MCEANENILCTFYISCRYIGDTQLRKTGLDHPLDRSAIEENSPREVPEGTQRAELWKFSANVTRKLKLTTAHRVDSAGLRQQTLFHFETGQQTKPRATTARG